MIATTLSKIIVFLAIATSISQALPIYYISNKCNDSMEYYTTTRIINYSILYSITTHDNKTKTNKTDKILYNNPMFKDYMDLITSDTNITLRGRVIFEYEILAPCSYICAMEIVGDIYTSKTIARYFETYYQPGSIYHMLCNSAGCRANTNYCKTFQIHDEL
jgi:hypothetical protein